MNFRSHSRWAPLRGAAWFALGFITLRVAYRVVFLGANGSGIVLWSGRPIHLDGPFRMISLFGPITTGGILSSALDALPFALGIMACGLLFALLDVRRFLALASRARFARGILTALAIGVSTYPALVQTWRSMRQMHRLRRERGGFSTLGPLFERTLERAATLGASMEARGFGQVRDTRELDCSRPAGANSVVLSHAGVPVLSIDSMEFSLGEFVLLTGATGSGKSTLLRALAGLHPCDERDPGSALTIGGIDRRLLSVSPSAGFVGYVPQMVRDSFVSPTVREELCFGLLSQGFSTGSAEVRVREIVNLLRLEGLLDRDVETLSAGESVLVALGAALVSRPTLLLLDEPFADLDAQQAQHVATVLAQLVSHTHMCVIVAEHRTALLSPVVTRHLAIEEAKVIELVEITPAVIERTPLIELVEITAPITALVGPNGSGKTTQLVARALAEPRTVALVPEYLSDFFVRDSVQAECERSDRTAHASVGTTRSTFVGLLGESFTGWQQHPRDLSAGQQLALAIAVQTAAAPRELLIDEPTRGLDASTRAQLAALIVRCAEASAVTIASHDAEFISLLNAEVVPV